MKTKLMLTLFTAFFLASNSYSQTIDTAALKVLQTSFSKLEKVADISYQMIFIDSMGGKGKSKTGEYGSFMRQNKVDTVYVHQIDKDNILYLFTNNHANYFTKDTLFTFQSDPKKTVAALNNWDDHEFAKYSIYNILGETADFASRSIESITFHSIEAENQFVINIQYKNKTYNNGTITNKLRYDRIWIDKTTYFPVKRRFFSRRENDLHEENTDIYEFCLSLPKENPARNFNLALFKDFALRKPKNNVANNGSVNKATALIGTLAKDFEAKNIKTGQKERLANYKGKVILLDFWYLSCSPCRTLMPVLARLQKKYKFKDFIIIGLNSKDENSQELLKYVTEKGFRYIQLYGNKKVENTYRIEAFPTTFLIDKKGIIKNVDRGYSEDFEDRISKMIDFEINQ